MGVGAGVKSTQDIIEELKRMECINYSHYSAPKPCTKDARNRLEQLLKDVNREKNRAHAHYENYIEMIKRVDRLASALERIRDAPHVV